MCKKTNYHNTSNTKIDKCMRDLIKGINKIMGSNFTLKACCCGHGKYPTTIVVKNKINNTNLEIISNKDIPRKRNIYKKDTEGYYYIPESILDQN